MTDWQTGFGGWPVLHAKGWLIPREAEDTSRFDDVGFRVVREIAKEAKPPDKVEPAVQPKN